MNALLQQVMGSIDGSVVQQLAGRMGTSTGQAQGAIDNAMPTLLAAIGQHAGSPGGADAIHSAAQEVMDAGNHGANVQGLFGQIFGGQTGSPSQTLAAASGLPQDHAEHMLAVLGPVILAAIGQHATQNGTGAQDLGQILGVATQHAQSQSTGFGGLLGSLFGQH